MNPKNFERTSRDRHHCTKTRYANMFEARKEASRLGMRAYPCPLCKGWHLTSRDVR